MWVDQYGYMDISYISQLGDTTPWINGQAVIKEGLLTLEAKL